LFEGGNGDGGGGGGGGGEGAAQGEFFEGLWEIVKGGGERGLEGAEGQGGEGWEQDRQGDGVVGV
jgi:hypothetical protein